MRDAGEGENRCAKDATWPLWFVEYRMTRQAKLTLAVANRGVLMALFWTLKLQSSAGAARLAAEADLISLGFFPRCSKLPLWVLGIYAEPVRRAFAQFHACVERR